MYCYSGITIPCDSIRKQRGWRRWWKLVGTYYKCHEILKVQLIRKNQGIIARFIQIMNKPKCNVYLSREHEYHWSVDITDNLIRFGIHLFLRDNVISTKYLVWVIWSAYFWTNFKIKRKLHYFAFYGKVTNRNEQNIKTG